MCVGEGVGCLLFIFLTHQKRKSQNKMKIIKLTTGHNLMLEDVELRLFYVPALLQARNIHCFQAVLDIDPSQNIM